MCFPIVRELANVETQTDFCGLSDGYGGGACFGRWAQDLPLCDECELLSGGAASNQHQRGYLLRDAEPVHDLSTGQIRAGNASVSSGDAPGGMP